MRTLWLGVVASTLLARGAHADDKAACLSATEQGQSLRVAHKLVEARAQFLLCARPTCPKMIQEACGGWLGEVDKSLPTVVLTAKGAGGANLIDVAVTVDGQPLATRLDGESVPVDPGAHVFHFAQSGGATLDKPFVVLEGQKDQRFEVTGLGTASAAGDESAGHTRRLVGLGLGGAGVVGLIVGGIFGGLTFSAWSSANGACPSHTGCSAAALSDRANAETFGTVSDIGFIGGGVLAAGGVALYFTAPKAGPSAVGVDIRPGGLALRGSF
jgi:hypothetical protein